MTTVGSLLQRVYSDLSSPMMGGTITMVQRTSQSLLSWVPYPRVILPLIVDQLIYQTLRVKLQTLNAHYWSRAVVASSLFLRTLQLSPESTLLKFAYCVFYIVYKFFHYVYLCETRKPLQGILQADADKSAAKVRDEIIFCLSNNHHLSLQHIERFLRENNGNFYLQASPVDNPVKLDGTRADYKMDIVTYKLDGYRENFINLLITGFVAYPNDGDITRGILTRAQNQLAISARAASELRLSQPSASGGVSLQETLQRSGIFEADRAKNKPLLYEKIMRCLQNHSEITLQNIECFLRVNNCHFMLCATRNCTTQTPLNVQGQSKPNIAFLDEYHYIRTVPRYRERVENLSSAGFVSQDDDTATVRGILEQAQRSHQQQRFLASAPLISGACSSHSPAYAASSSSSAPRQSLLPAGFSANHKTSTEFCTPAMPQPAAVPKTPRLKRSLSLESAYLPSASSSSSSPLLTSTIQPAQDLDDPMEL